MSPTGVLRPGWGPVSCVGAVVLGGTRKSGKEVCPPKSEHVVFPGCGAAAYVCGDGGTQAGRQAGGVELGE